MLWLGGSDPNYGHKQQGCWGGHNKYEMNDITKKVYEVLNPVREGCRVRVVSINTEYYQGRKEKGGRPCYDEDLLRTAPGATGVVDEIDKRDGETYVTILLDDSSVYFMNSPIQYMTAHINDVTHG